MCVPACPLARTCVCFFVLLCVCVCVSDSVFSLAQFTRFRLTQSHAFSFREKERKGGPPGAGGAAGAGRDGGGQGRAALFGFDTTGEVK